MRRSEANPALHCFAVFTALCTLALIALGGLVTSHGAGMAVPDWPNSYGYNMFALPFSYWVGGIFYEHSHRLFASFVGMLTTVLAVWLWLKEERRWLRWAGVAAFITVVVQGILGGLRVTLLKDELGIFHGVLAQLFLLLNCGIALFTSRAWVEAWKARDWAPVHSGLRYLIVAATVLIFLQLVIGATMRHQHAGLAIHDFPLAHGELWPPTDPEFIEGLNQRRMTVEAYNPITAAHVVIHMVHRIVALTILVLALAFYWVACRDWAGAGEVKLRRLAGGWVFLVLCQAGLGAATVLTNKAADVATAHVVGGALSLAAGAWLSLIALRSPLLRGAAEERVGALSGRLANSSDFNT